MQNITIIVFIILIRNIIDTFGIYGSGMIIMGHKIKLKNLIKYSFFISIFITPLRFLPVNRGIQINIIFLVMIILLYYWQTFHLLTAAGTVLIGGWSLITLEWFYTYFIDKLMLYPISELSIPTNIFHTLPPAIILVVLALLMQKFIKPDVKKTKKLFPIKNSLSGNRLKLIPAAQFLYMLLINMCLTLFYQEIPEWIPRLSPLFIYAMIVLSFHLSKKWLENKNKTFLLFEIIDIIIFIPLILLILLNTGGNKSVFKFLFLPLIVINTLKPNKYYGLLSIIISSMSLLSLNIFYSVIDSYSAQTLGEDLIYLSTFIIIFWIINNALTFEELLRNKILEKATTDELTGLFNPRYLYQHLDEETGEKYIIIMDLDNFKLVNDKLGHLAGDQLLKRIARNISEITRKEDIVIRYGGDEFIVIPDKNLDKNQVLKLAERLRLIVEQTSTNFLTEENKLIDKPITASLGIAQSNTPDINKLIKKADRALYKAKTEGKNRLHFLSKF